MDQFLAHFSFKIEILNDNSLSLGFTSLSLSISDLSVVFSDFCFFKKIIFLILIFNHNRPVFSELKKSVQTSQFSTIL
jgi:hypothetical protein